MRFELTVALKYLIPRWRQLSVSIISLISILVISLVVWLVVVFLSVTEGIEKKWVEELVSLNAPVRMTPTDAYYRSYYYRIDELSADSNFTVKSIGEKLASPLSDPYDATVDIELPPSFPYPDRYENGSLKDPVKEGWEIVKSISGTRPREYEVSFGNLRLGLLREEEDSFSQTYMTQVSYLASHDPDNQRFKEMVLPPSMDDFNNLLISMTHSVWEEEIEPSSQETQKSLNSFFKNVEISEVSIEASHFLFPKNLFPQSGTFKGIGVTAHNRLQHVIVPQKASDIVQIDRNLSELGIKTLPVELTFNQGIPEVHASSAVEGFPPISIAKGSLFKVDVNEGSLKHAASLRDVLLDFQGEIQGVQLQGKIPFDGVHIAKAHIKKETSSPLWLYAQNTIPKENGLGEGILLSKHFAANGVKLGDRGMLSYYTPTATSMQEQRLPVYVAGFYDPGLMPIGSKLIFADQQLVSQLRGNLNVQDQMLGNGINVWLADLKEAENIKQSLRQKLDAHGIGKYWNVESFHDYEFARPVLEQLESDKTLFTLIAIIILIVACSNIISMLILLVNDKKKEIGILQSMGASSRRIATIFGICGFATGLISSLLGTCAAIFTLTRLQSLVDFLSFLQGHEAFQAAFYGSKLPNELSLNALVFVLVATLIISILAGMIPAIKAARIRPSEILRTE